MSIFWGLLGAWGFIGACAVGVASIGVVAPLVSQGKLSHENRQRLFLVLLIAHYAVAVNCLLPIGPVGAAASLGLLAGVAWGGWYTRFLAEDAPLMRTLEDDAAPAGLTAREARDLMGVGHSQLSTH